MDGTRHRHREGVESIRKERAEKEKEGCHENDHLSVPAACKAIPALIITIFTGRQIMRMPYVPNPPRSPLLIKDRLLPCLCYNRVQIYKRRSSGQRGISGKGGNCMDIKKRSGRGWTAASICRFNRRLFLCQRERGENRPLCPLLHSEIRVTGQRVLSVLVSSLCIAIIYIVIKVRPPH